MSLHLNFQEETQGLQPYPGTLPVDQVIDSWAACPGHTKGPQMNQRFLATLVVFMVQGFRAEEARMSRSRTPELANCRAENRRLAVLMQSLMVKAGRGVDVTKEIDDLIMDWRALQDRKATWTGVDARREH